MFERLLIGLLTFACVASSTLAFAQVAPTPEQKELNAHAYEAMASGDPSTAIEDYLKSLEIGELNVTYLNLGRAYQKTGQCEEAWAAYDAVPGAPVVDKPPRDVVEQTLARYSEQLEVDCPTKLSVTCADESASFSVDDGGEHPCPGELDVEPGTRLVRAHSAGKTKLQSVLAVKGRTVQVEFERVAPAEVEEPAPARSIEPPAEASMDRAADRSGTMSPLVAGALIAGGLVLGVAGMAFDGVFTPAWPASSHDYHLGPKDFLPVAAYAGGLVMVGVGIWNLLRGD